MTKHYEIEWTAVGANMGGTWFHQAANSQEALADFYLDHQEFYIPGEGYIIEIESFSVEVI